MDVKDNLAKAYCIKRDAAVLAAVLDGNIEPLKQIGVMFGKPFRQMKWHGLRRTRCALR